LFVTAILLLFTEGSFRIKYNQYNSAVDLYNSGNRNNFGNKFHHRNDDGCTWIKSLYPHPYLGITHSNQQTCKLDNINKQGTSGDNFPVTKDEQYFDILFIGGSVAFNLVSDDQKQGKKSYFKQKLESSYRDKNGRKIRVFNGSMISWKQPQQLFFYLMNALPFDAVVSLEGVNEFTIPPSYDLDLPFDITFNQIKLPDLHQSIDYTFNNILANLRRTFQSSYAASYFEMKHNEYINREYSENRNNSFIYKMYKKENFNPDSLKEDRIEKYSHYLKTLSDTAKRLNQKWAIFFQPFLEHKKIIHINEEKYRLNNAFLINSYPPAVEVLVSQRHLHAESLLNIFSNNKDEIYSDYVHFKQDSEMSNQGHIIISDAIIRKLEVKWGLKSI
jgi:hypothetical protein